MADHGHSAGAALFARADAERLFQRVVRLASGGGDTTVAIQHQWSGHVRWANNDVISSGDTTNTTITIARRIRGANAPPMSTNRLDDASLRRVLGAIEYRMRYSYENPDANPLQGKQEYSTPEIYFESTATLGADERSHVGKALVQPMITSGLHAAGYLAVEGNTRAVFNTAGLDAYAQSTLAQYSVTVRNPEGTGSGWAGVDQNDWNGIDPVSLTARAQDKCMRSVNALAVEPGRYTTILEAQAVHDMMRPVVALLSSRHSAEQFPGPYHLSRGQSKIGRPMFDPRITITADPMDPGCSFMPFDGAGDAYRKVSWFTNGVLSELGYDRRYAVEELGRSLPQPNSNAYRMTGGTVSIEEMVATTKRGLLVTRLGTVRMVDRKHLVLTGVTRDGVWLVQDGTIKNPVKNFRFNESPLFVFNGLEQLGVPMRVFSPAAPAVVPPAKVRDFHFTSLADAV